ncbi:PucR family transcriptional regulator ligand-binding domain-containing protein [Sporolactobacillus shoreicorticis]|uniref:PucR family transcriptional regulator n=1 Tax=Sporolactobacillus shoreicorticis TaxID=1923877 RepID=A0ABW5S4H8_9BACL|nr:PucR family transcriptional regulator [Sporolactobacillus shoreicorticis]MCO7124310.1 PucR family transcriptional regulator ligand-binding domain-containing protein [Sporolactobacillus shoreicorticis]
MSTLNHLFALPELESIRLVAGKEGMNRLISGVNVMESDSLFDFFKEGELLVTTGINMEKDEQRLMSMVVNVYEHKASGVVLNVGPYIPRIPEQVREFANAHQFPIFDMPWAYRVADFVKITVQFLASAEQNQTRSKHALNELLFHDTPDYAHVYKELDQLGIKTDQLFSIIVCSFDPKKPPSSSIGYVVETTLSRKYRLLLSTHHDHQLIFLVVQIRGSDLPLVSLMQTIRNGYASQLGTSPLSLGRGNEYTLTKVMKSYHEALMVLRLTKRHPNLQIYEYNELGAYRIIMDVQEHRVIEDFCQKYLGALYRYDRLHETDLVHFLRVFLEEDGRTSQIARKEFIHRNTVLYKVKKIEAILGADLCHPFVKTNLQLAFMIEDMIK